MANKRRLLRRLCNFNIKQKIARPIYFVAQRATNFKPDLGVHLLIFAKLIKNYRTANMTAVRPATALNAVANAPHSMSIPATFHVQAFSVAILVRS